MSRVVIHEPVASFTSTHKVAQPAPIQTASVAHEAVAHQFSGDITVVPAMPTN